ncbi:MAG: S8 family serine peptidase [Planctomycetota bacterium]|jgi:hypothetical protein
MNRTFLILTASAFLAAPATAAEVICSADLDGDGQVATADLLALLSVWGTDPGGPPDFDGDGNVGTSDLLFLLSAWGPTTFAYPPPSSNPEAEQIGLEMLGPAGPLLVPQEDFERIDRDLALIRAFEPGLVGQTHSMAWAPNQLIVQVPDVNADAYVCQNEYYQVIDESNLFSDWWVLTFAGNMNVEAMVGIYMALDEVKFAEPNFLIGGQNFWVPTPMGGGVWRWDIDDGFHDCFDGCDCHRLYVIETDDPGNVKLIDYQEVGQSWCDFGG